MKRVAAILLATMMVFSLAACSSDSSSSSSESSSDESTEEKAEDAEETESAADLEEDVEFEVEAEFEPVEGYDKYTVIEYNLAGQDVPVTVCANSGETEFELLCNFYGDDQDWRGTWNGSEVTTEFDQTSFMEGDAPGIIEEAISQGKWAAIK